MRIKNLDYRVVAVISLALASLGSLALADAHGNKFVHSRPLGGQVYMMYQDHMALYTFENDPHGVSTCYGDCAKKWPPALLKKDTRLGTNYSLIKRKDGTWQAAFKGKPLYLSILDKKVGDVNGDGVDDAWFLARPDF